MSYTLGQAAKATGLSKPTISEAIKKGRISARKNESGSFEIDPSELHRVYPPLASPASKEESQTEHFRTHDLTAKIMVLESQVQALGELKDQIAAERDDLRTERNRLLDVIEEQAGSVRQLTYQPPPTAEPAPAPEPQPAANQTPQPKQKAHIRNRRWVYVLFWLVMVALFGGFFVVGIATGFLKY